VAANHEAVALAFAGDIGHRFLNGGEAEFFGIDGAGEFEGGAAPAFSLKFLQVLRGAPDGVLSGGSGSFDRALSWVGEIVDFVASTPGALGVGSTAVLSPPATSCKPSPPLALRFPSITSGV